MPDSDSIESKLKALQSQYQAHVGQTLTELATDVDSLSRDADPQVMVSIRHRLHKLSGSGGTFGFMDLSRQASALETIIATWLNESIVPAEADWRMWVSKVRGLRNTVLTPTHSTSALPGQVHHQSTDLAEARIVLIEDDSTMAKQLATGLAQFGYQIICFDGFETAEAQLLLTPPDLLVVDIMLPGHTPDDGTVGVQHLFARLGTSIPVIYLTARTDLSAQLAAAKTNATAFLKKPVDVPALAAQIELVLQERQQQPFRVLIVDDDEMLAEHYRLVLKAAGMLVKKTSQPMDVFTLMAELNPDLVLLDLYMPACSGAELARMIRFNPERQSLPLVYLSAEQDLDRQIVAMGSGADDFLTKPLSDLQLVAAVKARAKRSRQLNDLMNKDSLTGLLKHASIKDRLTEEVQRASRQRHSVSAVMVDIDHFKRVNDTWGHPMGDQVIKTLGHLLRQRLRRQDSVGRYGGEEFVAVLPECTAADAQRLLDSIRQHFANMPFTHDGQRFNVTLSAGIASSDISYDAVTLLAAADKALYVAKHGGRNQVQIAPAPAPEPEVLGQQLLRGD